MFSCLKAIAYPNNEDQFVLVLKHLHFSIFMLFKKYPSKLEYFIYE